MALNTDIESEYLNYNLYYKFIEKFAPSGFKGIDPNDPLLLELDEMMLKHKQFFYIGDMIQMKFLFTSNGCKEMTGINPADLSPYHFFEFVHPSDYQRFSSARTTFFKQSQDLFLEEKGETLFSMTIKLRRTDGEYINVLFQRYLFLRQAPVKTVYVFSVHTNVDWIKKIKNGYYYYLGKDMSQFRYPDKNLLNQCGLFSVRELEIIKLVGLGYKSEQIGSQLFISPHTVNKHRRNILKKSGMAHVTDLILCLKEQGRI